MLLSYQKQKVTISSILMVQASTHTAPDSGQTGTQALGSFQSGLVIIFYPFETAYVLM